MNKLSILPIALIASLLSFIPSKAQERRTMNFDASTSLMLSEFQAMLVEEDGKIKVQVQMGTSDGSEDKLEQGDLIIMMNGKRATNIATLRELYEAAPIDEEIKIGVRRGEEQFILRELKCNVPEGGQRMVMQMDFGDDESGERPTIIPELGFMLSNANDKVTIQRLLDPLLPTEFKKLELVGFTITSINGKEPSNAEEAKEWIDKLDVGNEIVFIFSSPDDEISVTIKKPKANGNVNISIDD